MYIYTVRPGDTLSAIAARSGVSVGTLAADNSLRYPDRLVVGQHLIIDSDYMKYKISAGQTMYSLSLEFGVPLDDMLAANPDVNPLALRIGQTVNIPRAAETPRRPALINGFAYPSITDSALKCSLPYLTFISPFSYSVTPEGELDPISDERLTAAASQGFEIPLLVVTNIYNGSFSTSVLSQILASPAARERLISSVIRTLSAKHYYGVNLDMEYISPDDKDAYNSFLTELSDRVHRANCILLTSVAPKYSAGQQGLLYESHDYKVQGKAADYVIIMMYEWGYTFSEPMSVQPINEARRVLNYAVTDIPSGKIIMGMPNYGYDWRLPYIRGTAAAAVGLGEALETALRHNSEILYDEKTQTPYFYYTEKGTRHVVWFDDAKSIDAKLRLVDEYGLAGVSYWTVNRCFIPNWVIAENLFDIIKL